MAADEGFEPSASRLTAWFPHPAGLSAREKAFSYREIRKGRNRNGAGCGERSHLSSLED